MEEKTITQEVEKLRLALCEAEAVLVGAGAGISIAAGLATSGERFDRFFGDFSAKYQMKDMYEGAGDSFESPEEQWAYLSRFIYLNRYEKAPLPVYEKLYELLDGGEGKPKKDYFILTTNQDHQFQKAGFDKERIFSTQGDLGLLQCSRPCLPRIYENKSRVVKMVLSQGFSIGEEGELVAPTMEDGKTDYRELSMEVGSMLLPQCPICGSPLMLNVRAGGEEEIFVKEDGWHEAALCFNRYLSGIEKKKVLLLELGAGNQYPDIIKYQFWNLAREWENATYACVNLSDAAIPEDLAEKGIRIEGNLAEVLALL